VLQTLVNLVDRRLTSERHDGPDDPPVDVGREAAMSAGCGQQPANVSTVGFGRGFGRAGEAAARRDVYALESTVGAPPARRVQATGRPLDVAMKGNSWLAVQGLDGTEAYTRAGALDVDAQGQLVTKTGLTVLGDGGPIAVPANSEVNIAGDGTVSAKAAWPPSSIGRLKLVTPESPSNVGPDGLFRAGRPVADASARRADRALRAPTSAPSRRCGDDCRRTASSGSR
jgi:flagellar basal-body rod protein FlgF